MKNLMRSGAVLAFALGLGAAGCGSKAGEAIGKMKDFKNKLCACKDKACAEKVQGEMLEWGLKNAEKYKNTKPSESEMKEMSSIQEEMTKCAAKLAGGDAPAGG